MSTTARKNRRWRAQIKRRAQDEEMTRFGWYVVGVVVLEVVVFLWVTGALRVL
jgi:hypothetical protein